MNPFLFFAGAGTAATGLYLLGRKYLFPGEGEGEEPAAPIAMPELPPTAKPGSSGIAADDREVEALARGIASEAGDGPLAEQRAVAWSIRNMLRGKSIYAVAHPWRAQKGRNPPFSSAREAREEHRKLAREVLAADQSEDPTGGSTSFFEPRMQDAFAEFGEMARAGKKGAAVSRNGVKTSDVTRFKNYHRDAAGIRAKWSPGSTLYARAGRFEFWGSAPVFAKRGGTVRTIVTGMEAAPAGDTLLAPADGAAGDLEALARMLETEFGKRTAEEREMAAWAIRNRAALFGKTVREILAPWGAYGSRETSGGYASTRKLPAPETRAEAARVLAAASDSDPSGGAVAFWSPGIQDQMKALGDLARAAREAGDEEKFAKYARFLDFDEGEDEVRERHRAVGLRVARVTGGLELLAPAKRERR